MTTDLWCSAISSAPHAEGLEVAGEPKLQPLARTPTGPQFCNAPGMSTGCQMEAGARRIDFRRESHRKVTGRTAPDAPGRSPPNALPEDTPTRRRDSRGGLGRSKHVKIPPTRWRNARRPVGRPPGEHSQHAWKVKDIENAGRTVGGTQETRRQHKSQGDRKVGPNHAGSHYEHPPPEHASGRTLGRPLGRSLPTRQE